LTNKSNVIDSRQLVAMLMFIGYGIHSRWMLRNFTQDRISRSLSANQIGIK